MKLFLDAFVKNKTVIKAMIKQSLMGKYRNTFLSLGWNILEPVLLTTIIFIVFTSIKVIHDEQDYWVYLSSGIFTMTFIMSCLRGRATYTNSNYFKKIPMPKWIPVFADTVAQFLSILIAYVVITIGYSFVFKLELISVLFILPSILLLFAFGLGCSFFFSTLTVKYSDLGRLMSIVSRIMIWLTPVFFYLNQSKEILQEVCICNPLTYFIESAHYICSYGVDSGIKVVGFDFTWYFGFQTLFAFIALTIGYLYFRKNQYKITEML